MKPEITIAKQSEDSNLSAGTLKNVIAFLCLGSALYIFISLLSYSALDPSFSSVASLSDSVVNLGGPFGAYLSDALFSVAGMGAYLILFIASFAAIRLLFFYKPKNNLYTLVKLSSATVLVLSFSTICEYYFSGDFFPQGSSGGILGEIIFTNLSNIFGVVGSLLFIFIFTLIAASLTFSFSWLTVIDSVGRYSLAATSYLMNALKGFVLMSFEKLQSIEIKEFFKTKKIPTEKPLSDAQPRELNLPKTKPASEDSSEPLASAAKTILSEPSSAKEEISKASSTVYKSKDSKLDAEMPSTDLLDRALDDGSSLSQDELNQLADLLEVKLDEFGVEAKVTSVIPGPVVTRFEIQPAPGTKASKITNIAQDIARSLAVKSVRVVEVIEGKSVVGVEIPNTNRKMVRLTEILSSDVFNKSVSPLSLALGQDIAGKPIVVDLAKMPHLLVAGTTGSGKSVTLHTMLVSLLYKSDPTDLQLLLVDPKMLELSVYDGIPHLLNPVITDMSDATNGLRWCVQQMEKRYRIMSELKVRDIMAYNKLVLESEQSGKKLEVTSHKGDDVIYHEKLPYIVVVIDEFADMMLQVVRGYYYAKKHRLLFPYNNHFYFSIIEYTSLAISRAPETLR